MLELNKAYNMDCMEGMREFPDGYFDLAVVDPPYGDAGQDFKRQDKSRFGGKFDRYKRENLTGGVPQRLTGAAAGIWRSMAQRSSAGIRRRETITSRNYSE